RPMFRRSVMERRCVIPTTGFYEWGPDGEGKKRKYRFNLPGTRALYLAGLWNNFAEERKCVILTTAANASMEGIHDRMPVVLLREELERWVQDSGVATEILHRVPPELAVEALSGISENR
ncbi:SOS response-associated peptidase family protein, partial [uncultured Oscillibacter sp.]|uniref:SOS response-associated peptidase family protein n=1 Tax=uncultured Oscillibacter sp. TaxID=876091 RepID=UPI0025EBA7B4